MLLAIKLFVSEIDFALFYKASAVNYNKNFNLNQMVAQIVLNKNIDRLESS